jgi:hypothetical protein
MEAQHIGPLLGMQLFLVPVAYFVWVMSVATYQVVFDHSHPLRRAVLRWRREHSMMVDGWFWFGTVWAAMNVAVYTFITGAL